MHAMNSFEPTHEGARAARPDPLPPATRLRDEAPRVAVRPLLGALMFGGTLCALPAQAFEFGSGEVEGSLDTTVSHGLLSRVADRDDALTADVNGNDGNLNYDKGLVSNASKFTSDLELNYRNFGAFVRVSGFYDFENENGGRERTPLSDDALEKVGSDVELLDAYVTGAFEAGDAAVDVRLGSHVLNWGESTFIQNGINAVNPFDVSKLRLPGAELREGLEAVPLVSASASTYGNLSVEGFYQLDWEETEIDAVGSYFSVTDYVGPGADKAVIALPGLELSDVGLTGTEDDPFALFAGIPGFEAVTAKNPDFLTVERRADREPDDSGQWGLAFRWLAEGLNDTEFGFYYVNHHSRLPIVSGHTGTMANAAAGLAAAGAIGAAATPTALAPIVAAGVTRAVGRALAAAGCAAPTDSPQCAAVATAAQAEATPLVAGSVQRAVRGAALAAGVDVYARGTDIEDSTDDAYYFIEYPEDIQLFGVSFNTEIGTSGWALQGEYSHRRDAPLQLAERKVFANALEPFNSCLLAVQAAQARALAMGQTPQQAAQAASMAGGACIQGYAANGSYDSDGPGRGYVLRNVSQAQATATKVFGPVLGADSGAFVGEVAVMHVHNMPDGNGVDTTLADGTPNPAFATAVPIESPAGGVGDDFNDADATSWGYRLAARLDYNNAVGAANLFPYLQFGHGVSGNSPAPSGSFVEGRTALTLGLRIDYLSRWEADLNFTAYGGSANELHDRDFVSATVKYSF